MKVFNSACLQTDSTVKEVSAWTRDLDYILVISSALHILKLLFEKFYI